MIDLNHLLSPEDRVVWTLTDAMGINDAGQIVGRGIKRGNHRAFLLTPL